jgi:hypothetical protein
MKTTTQCILAVGLVALLLGAVFGALLFPKTVEVTTTVTEKVEKEVIKEVPLDLKATYLDPALELFLKEDDLDQCDGEEYDMDQAAVKSVYPEWSLWFDEDESSTEFQVKLKYLDKDTEQKCYATYDVEVYYEQDEDPEVTFSLV